MVEERGNILQPVVRKDYTIRDSDETRPFFLESMSVLFQRRDVVPFDDAPLRRAPRYCFFSDESAPELAPGIASDISKVGPFHVGAAA
jgi:hypothetical protein